MTDPVAQYLAKYGGADPDDPVAKYLSRYRAPEPEEDDPAWKRAGRFLGQGVTQAAISASRLNPLTHLVAPLREQRETVEARHEDLKEDPKGVLENAAYYTGRLVPEMLSTAGAGRAAAGFGLRGLARVAATNLPSSATFAADKESAIVQSDNPAVRFGAELAANVAGDEIIRGAGAAFRALRKDSEVFRALRGRGGRAVADVAEEAGEAIPEQIASHADDLARKPWEMTRDELEAAMPPAGPEVGGLRVRGEIPNQSSIEASVDNPTVLPGVRSVPMSLFDPEYTPKIDAKTRALQGEIQASKEINPLIVGIDDEGAYIIEGGHRFDALRDMGAPEIPALVVLDETALYDAIKRAGRAARPEVLAEYADDLQRAVDSPRVAEGPTEILRDELDVQRLARRSTQAADVNPDEYANIAKFGLSPDGEERMRRIIQEVVADEGRVPKEVIPNEQTIKESLGLSPKDILSVRGRSLNRVEMIAAKNFIKTNDTEIDALARELSNPEISITERERIINEIAEREQLTGQLVSPFSKSWSEAGRALQSLRLIARDTSDPFTWYVQAAKTLNGKPLTDTHRAEINRLLKAGDKSGLVDYVAGLRQASVGEKIGSLFKTGLLTNPLTHLANFTGNTTMAFLESAKDVPGVIFDRMIGAVTGLETKAPSIRGLVSAPIEQGAKTGYNRGRRYLGDVMRAMKLDPSGLRQSARGQYDEIAALAGRETDDALSKLDMKRQVKFNNAFLDAYNNNQFRMLGESDAIFSQMAAVRSLEEQARLAAKKGLGEGEDMAARVRWLRENPTDEMAMRAIQDAEYSTFRDKTLIGRIAGGIKRPLGVVGDVIVPFTQTPASIATKVVVDYTPLGGMKALYKLARAATEGMTEASQRQIVDAIGRSSVGSAPIALGYWLASQGLATGELPRQESERSQFYLEGKVPFAVKVGGQWRSLERLSPAGNLLFVGVGLHRAFTEAGLTAADRATLATTATARMLTQQPFLTGTSRAIDTITDPELRGLGKFVGGTAAATVPAAVRALARGVDPTIREQAGVTENVKASIPFVSRDLPARVDVLGQEAKRSQGVAGQFLDIFRSSPDKLESDRLLRDLRAAGFNIPTRDKRAGESPEQYEQRMRSEGRELRDRLERLVNRSSFQNASPEEQNEKLKKLVSGLRDRQTERAK